MSLQTKTFHNIFFKNICFCLFFCSYGTLQLYGQYFSVEKAYKTGIYAFNDKNYYSARLLFQEILHKDVNGQYSDKCQYYLALTYYYEKDYQNSIFELKTFLRDYPSSKLNVKARYWIGESYYFLKDYAKAREIHYQLVREHEENPIIAYALYTIGYSYVKNKRYDEAITELNRALKVYPNSKISHKTALQLGMAYFSNEEYKEARKVFKNIILNYKDAPLSQQSQIWIGKSFFVENDYENAMREFQFILEKSPTVENAGEALYHIALIQFQEEKIELSIGTLKSILSKYISWSRIDQVYFRLGQIFYKKRINEEALFFLKNLLNDYKQSAYYADALTIYIEIAHSKQNTDQIVDFLDKVLSSGIEGDQFLKVLHKKADILFEAKLFKKALRIYEEVDKKTFGKKKAEILYMQAQANYKLNLYEQAMIHIKGIIENKTYVLWKPDAYFLEAEISFALSDYTNSLLKYNQITRFYKTHRRNFDASMGIGWVYFELKQYARSRDTFKKLLTKYKNQDENIQIRMALASCEYNLRDFKSAVQTYKRVIDQKKDFPKEAEEALFRMGWARYREKKYDISKNLFLKYQQEYAAGAFLLEAQYYTGWSHFQSKEFQESATAFLKTIQSSPKENPFHRKASLQYAKTIYILKDYEKACQVLSGIIQDFPESEEIEESLYVGSNCYLKINSPKKSIGFFKKLKRVAPDSAYLKEMLYSIADYYSKHGYFQKAHLFLEEVAQQSKKENEKWLIKISQCDLFIAQKKYSEATNLLKSILENKNDELIPFRAETLNRLFETYFEINAYDKIFEDFTRYKEIFNSDEVITSELKFWKARVWMQKKDYEKSDQLFNELLLNKKYKAIARYYLGLSYYQQKKWDEAYDFLKQVAEKSNDRLAPQARFKVGEIYFIKKEYEKALLQYTKIVYLYSDITKLYEDSLYKIIQCFNSLKIKKEYKRYIFKLREEFPQSSYLQEFDE